MAVSVLITIGAFLIAIGVLVAVHEFGHFWVAKKLGVKVLRYSIGFGRPLWKWRGGADGTEYVIAALPLGGYVKMLDEREGEVAEHERARAFNRQSVGKRFAIVFAGPAFNFLFAIAAYWLMLVLGVTGMRPVVGDVLPGSPAAEAGLRAGHEIVAVEGRPTPIWDVALQAMLPNILDRSEVQITAQTERGERTFTLDLSRVRVGEAPGELFRGLGLTPWRPPIEPVIGRVLDGSPAQRADLRAGDRITAVDDQAVDDWDALVNAVRERPDRRVAITVVREGQTLDLLVQPERSQEDGVEVVRIGITPAEQPAIPAHMQAQHRYGPWEAFTQGFVKTGEMSALTLKMLGKIITGEASVRNLSGPISIATYAGYSASAGLPRFLDFLAIVSISLGILNLLPIPILDGGHLMYYLIEAVKGSPVSERVEAAGQRIGIALLILLMSLAFYNDLLRLFG